MSIELEAQVVDFLPRKPIVPLTLLQRAKQVWWAAIDTSPAQEAKERLQYSEGEELVWTTCVRSAAERFVHEQLRSGWVVTVPSAR